MPRTIALAALTVLELAPHDMVSYAAAAGYSHLGLWLLAATPDEPPIQLSATRRWCARSNVGSPAAACSMEIFRLKADTDVCDYLPALETGARPGAQHVLVAGNDSHLISFKSALH